MMGVSLPSQSSAVLTADRRRFGRRRSSRGTCRAERRGVVPKREPFSRGRLERLMPDPPLLQKTEKNLTDYCSVLKDEECYSCWEAYLEFRHLKDIMPKEAVEKLVLDAGSIKSLISTVLGLSRFRDNGKNKEKNEMQRPTITKVVEEEEKPKPFPTPDGIPLTTTKVVEEKPRPFPIPDGIPMTKEELEELEEDERALLPDSPWTRLLRAYGRMPDWYTPRPDHETD